MNTHLLIPIEDIEEIIEHLRSENRKDYDAGEYDFQNFKNEGAKHSLLALMAKYKQISLSEDDINNRAHETWERKYLHSPANGTYSEGYKQALKDLLK